MTVKVVFRAFMTFCASIIVKFSVFKQNSDRKQNVKKVHKNVIKMILLLNSFVQNSFSCVLATSICNKMHFCWQFLVLNRLRKTGHNRHRQFHRKNLKFFNSFSQINHKPSTNDVKYLFIRKPLHCHIIQPQINCSFLCPKISVADDSPYCPIPLENKTNVAIST